jgi:hypothetical protein
MMLIARETLIALVSTLAQENGSDFRPKKDSDSVI